MSEVGAGLGRGVEGRGIAAHVESTTLRSGQRAWARPAPDARHVVGQRREVLASIAHPLVNLASYRRSLPEGLADDLSKWLERDPPDVELTLPSSRRRLGSRVPTLSLLPPRSRAFMARELDERLADVTLATRAPSVQVSFGPVRSTQCPRFHVDYVRYRLLTTYFGPGTEWAPDAIVDRAALEAGLAASPGAGPAAIVDERRIERAAPGEVLFMKGRGHASAPGVVHRSPALHGEARVVLTLTVHHPKAT